VIFLEDLETENKIFKISTPTAPLSSISCVWNNDRGICRRHSHPQVTTQCLEV